MGHMWILYRSLYSILYRILYGSYIGSNIGSYIGSYRRSYIYNICNGRRLVRMYIDGWIVYYMAFSAPPLDLPKAVIYDLYMIYMRYLSLFMYDIYIYI